MVGESPRTTSLRFTSLKRLPRTQAIRTTTRRDATEIAAEVAEQEPRVSQRDLDAALPLLARPEQERTPVAWQAGHKG